MKKINPRFVFRLFGIGLFVCMFHASQGQNTSTSEATTRYEKINLLFYGASSSQEVTVAIKNGKVYLADDIILFTEKEYNLKKLEKGGILIYNTYRWPDGRIPYKVSNIHIRYNDIIRAIDYINLNTNLCLVPYEENTDEDYLDFDLSTDVCQSYVGRITGRQEILIGSGCDFGRIVHEICHAAGMFHEQSRNDRDTFVHILEDNIIETEKHNFQQYGSSGSDIGVYDYGSIMHYEEKAFSKNGLATIKVLKQTSVTIGQREKLSEGDIATLNRMYPQKKCEDCEIPTNLEASIISSAAATLSWELIDDATAYRLEYRTKDGSEWIGQNMIKNVTTIGNLSPNQIYEFRVSAICRFSQTAFSNPAEFQTACGAPSWISRDGTYIFWETIPGDGYTMEVKGPSSTNWTSYTTYYNSGYLDVQENGTYYVRVKTICDANNRIYSDYSQEFAFRYGCPDCPVPYDIIAQELKPTVAKIKWSAFTGIQKYKIYYKELTSNTWQSADVNTNMYTLENLVPETYYQIAVSTLCIIDNIEQEGCVLDEDYYFKTPARCLITTTISAVSDIQSNSAKVNWEAQNDTKSFTLEYRKQGEQSWNRFPNLTALSTNLNNLQPNTTYECRIITTCLSGVDGDPSEIKTFKTLGNSCSDFQFDPDPIDVPVYYPCDTRPYATPVIGGTAPYKYKWSNGSTESYIQNVPAGTYGVTVTDAKGCNISKNVIVPLIEKPILTIGTIKAATCNKLDGEATVNVSKGTPPYNYEWSNWTYNAKLTGVSAGTYQVTVTDNKGCYTSLSINIPAAALATPSGVSISNITTSSATVSWNNTNAEQYKVEYRVGTQVTWSLYGYVNTPSVIMNGLLPGNTYSVKITALCGSTNSASSAIKSFTTLINNKLPTVAITAPANNATYNAPATVNVTATASDPDGTISKVEFYLNNTLVSTDNAAPYNATLSNLAAGTYTLTAKAYDNLQASATASITITVRASSNVALKLGWPLRQTNGQNDPGYYAITNFVDHDPTSGVKDYNCGTRTYNGHAGTDLALYPFPWYKMTNNQVEVITAEAGTIIEKVDGNFDQNCSSNSGNLGNFIKVRHSNGSITIYGHLKKNALTTKGIGQNVVKGEFLGFIGSSGNSTSPHLHFEVLDNTGKLIDPFAGSCNALNGNTSWWETQRSYNVPSISLIATHSGEPYPGDGNDCPGSEKLNFQNNFTAGATIYFTAYYQDQQINQIATYKIYRPDGSVWRSWTHTSPQSYTMSFWYWYYTFSTNEPSGTWKYEVNFNNRTVTHDFTIAPSSCSLSASPSILNYTSTGGTQNIAITATNFWTIIGIPSWLSLNVTAGSNNRTISVTATANNAANSRAANLTITCGGVTKTVSITQAGLATTTNNNTLVLNGTSDHKESPISSSYQTIKSFTLETWVKFNNPGVSTNDFIAEVGNSNYTKLWFWYNNDNTFGLPSKNIAIGYNGAQGGFNNGPDFMYDFSPQAGAWYHLAFSYNNSTRQITLYINGVSRGSRTVTGNAPEININNLKLYLGKRIFGGIYSHFFDGQMDDFRMWNYARSASEITNNYKTELTGKESGLIAYYKFDETSAGTNKDCSANELHLAQGTSRPPLASTVSNLSDVSCGTTNFTDETPALLQTKELEFDGISVYPNPTSGVLNIAVNNPSDIPSEWIVQDATGRIIHIEKREIAQDAQQDNFVIDFSRFSNGLYFLSAHMKNKIIVRKLVITE